ncbi:bifunctional sugar phosphate isomerase/epimerase/4-hydroxyphenylpyruvate dioxygenase family protein [Terrarubrum flagellatum]|uniref:bifunctional sugar phosphate isomerase/epimerase/4-hydroxyphenylpyruvate dioxygenase family protein n=1 Tax=Terrirubrum flagellatum TaxID=2895980 RepID=UPI0031453657
MKTSIATVCLSGDLAEKIDAAAQAGFDGVEIFENDLLAFDGSARQVGQAIRDAGLAVTVFQPFRDFEGLPEPQRARAFDRAERKFDVMQELGTDLILVCSNVSPQALGGVDRAADDFAALGERAAKRGLKVGYEALAWGRFVNDHRDAWEIVRRANHPAVGLILDSFHTLSRGIDVSSIRSIPKDKLFLVQLADAPKLDLDLLSWSRHFRNMPGQGSLPVADFMRAVTATGFDGVVSLEVFNDQFRAGSARVVAVDGQRSLAYLQDQIAPEPKLPPKARCESVEFIEFAVDEANAIELEKLLSALGFARRGRHRSKEVSVWTQGRIHLVVNSEHDGFAHSSYIVHGPSVCAICLKVDDAHSAFRRATRLGATPFRQPVIEGELDIPAIRGVGGSLIYLVDGKSELGDLWTIDFERLDDAAEHPQTLVDVDHISQSMDYGEMLSWLLFYTSIFDLTKAPELDIPDPAGLVRSQVIQTEKGELRLVLNGSQSQRTMSGRFLAEFFGSGVQHVAFNTNDIFATARALKEAGLPTVPVPENYYDDLAARFDLDQSLLDDLASFGILYDRDQQGEYFQIYTLAFQDRFFFELVERRNDYAGFGAANAPIRLASQARLSRHPAVPRR